jgi:hypothetical protein
MCLCTTGLQWLCGSAVQNNTVTQIRFERIRELQLKHDKTHFTTSEKHTSRNREKGKFEYLWARLPEPAYLTSPCPAGANEKLVQAGKVFFPPSPQKQVKSC